jgi:hypothetical protein
MPGIGVTMWQEIDALIGKAATQECVSCISRAVAMWQRLKKIVFDTHNMKQTGDSS